MSRGMDESNAQFPQLHGSTITQKNPDKSHLPCVMLLVILHDSLSNTNNEGYMQKNLLVEGNLLFVEIKGY